MASIVKATPVAGKVKAAGVSLKAMVFSVTLAAALAPLGIYGFLSYSEITTNTTATVNGALLDSNKANARLVKTWVDASEQTIKAMAQSTDITSLNAQRAKDFLMNANGQTPAFYTINLHDSTGQQIARSSNDKLINVADRPYFKKPFKENLKSYIDSGISRANGKGFIAFGVQVVNQEGVIGVLAGLSVIDSVTDQVTGGKIGKTGISYLIDTSEGLILAHPDSTMVGKTLSTLEMEKARLENINHVNDGVSSTGKEIKHTVNAVSGNIVLISEIDADEMRAPIQAVQMKILLFVLGAAIFATMMAFLLANSISKKINQLAALVNSASKSKSVAEIIDYEKQISSVGGARELQMIAQAIVRLTSSIKIAMRSL